MGCYEGHAWVYMGGVVHVELSEGFFGLTRCSSYGSNPQELFLSLQLISAALHGSSFHRATVYISDPVE